MKLTKKDFKVFLVTNDLDQKRIAKALGITEATIVNYNRNGRYPLQFQFALRGLISDINGEH
jgi:hypothetical protein